MGERDLLGREHALARVEERIVGQPDVLDQARKLRPERFVDETRIAKRPPAYVASGSAGPAACPGSLHAYCPCGRP